MNETSLGQKISSLITRLDRAFGAIRDAQGLNEMPASSAVLKSLEAQSIVYAGFLTDIQEGRISTLSQKAQEMVVLVNAFCQLIEADLFPKLSLEHQ